MDGHTDGHTDGHWMDSRMDGRTDNVKTVYPTQTKFGGEGGWGGINDFSTFFPYKYTGHKFDLAIKRSKVNLPSSFEQTCQTLSPQCYTPKFSLEAFLVLEEKIFITYEHGGHLN